MGLTRAIVTLSNPADDTLMPISANALVDTGALFLCVPQHVAIQLRLTELQRREVTTADGTRHLCPYVGPVQVAVANRKCFTGALVLGDEVLLGALPMDDMDLVVSPARRTVEPNPASPNIASTIVK